MMCVCVHSSEIGCVCVYSIKPHENTAVVSSLPVSCLRGDTDQTPGGH